MSGSAAFTSLLLAIVLSAPAWSQQRIEVVWGQSDIAPRLPRSNDNRQGGPSGEPELFESTAQSAAEDSSAQRKREAIQELVNEVFETPLADTVAMAHAGPDANEGRDAHKSPDNDQRPRAEEMRQDSRVDANDTVADDPITDMDWESIFEPVPREPQVKPVQLGNTSRDPYYGKPDQQIFPWTARNLAHRTLYFQDMPLERYGQSCGCLQPFKSAALFLADAATWPLQWIHERPCDLHYVLPLDRPGLCSPPLKQSVIPVPK